MSKFQVSSLKFQVSRQRLLFISIFSLVGFVLLQLPINGLAGANVKFTMFDLFAPISGAILGTGVGIISVLVVGIVNIIVHGTLIDKAVIIRLIPTLFAVWFFAKRDIRLLFVPAIAILAFNLHPIGRTVWYYSLFWLIPYLVWPLKEKSLLARSLGATFIAHSVGGAAWIWAFNLPAVVWKGLIPIVIMERAIFALGISASYILVNNLLYMISKKVNVSIPLDKRVIVKFFH